MRNPPDIDLPPTELATAPNYLGNPELVSALIRGWLDPCLARRIGKSGPAFALKESKGRIAEVLGCSGRARPPFSAGE